LLMTNILRCDIHRETALTVLRHHFERMNGPAPSECARPRAQRVKREEAVATGECHSA
jgi:hypothetical protein